MLGLLGNPFASEFWFKIKQWCRKIYLYQTKPLDWRQILNTDLPLFVLLQIFQQGAEKWLTLTQSLKVKAFQKDLKALLESQPDGCIALGNFVSVYMRFFGRKCKIATFGFSKLTELMEAVPQVAKVTELTF